MRIGLILCLLLGMWLAPAGVAAAAPPANLVQAELLADVATIQPGKPFTFGVKLKIHPGWHVYWKYAGDSGMPTKIKWKFPTGFEAGEVEFPIPKRIELPGGVVNYGYEDEVVLMTRVMPPSDLKVGSTADLLADVSWLVCEDSCIPGKASLKLSILVDSSAPSANEKVFQTWKSQLPAKGQASDLNLKLADDGAFVAQVNPPAFAKELTWFPAPPAGAGVEDASPKESTFTFKLAPPAKKDDRMGFLVAYTDETGHRRGVEFVVELPSASK